MKIGIVGAGIGGIATAIRMAVRGYDVSVYEANSYPGGKLAQMGEAGFRFDAGPSLFTMPQYVEELFKIAGHNPGNFFKYKKLPVLCNYFWEDDTRLSAWSDKEKFAEEVYEKLGVEKHILKKAHQSHAVKYDLTGKIFLENSLHKAKTWLQKDVGKALLQLHKLDIFRTMNQVNERELRHPKLVQLFNRYATYNGSNPYEASGILNIIPHFEYEFGAYLPIGGMHAITKSLVKLAEDQGVNFYYNKTVEKINIRNKKAQGLVVEGESVDFDSIVCNMDIFFAYKKLMADQRPPERILKQPKSSSALIFYWGIKGEFPELDIHNILFSEDYKNEFEHIFNKKTICEDPTVYINITSKQEKTDAPKGCENWFTMINVPHVAHQNWPELIKNARENILDKISRILKKDIRSLILCEQVLEPLTIQSKTASHLGSLYGTSSNNQMAAFNRHPNFSNKIKNLYFCGGSVHPGGGIPLCLLSAKIIDDLIHDQ